VLAVFLGAKAPKYWRAFHALMYAVLLFGVVYGQFIDNYFQNLGIILIYNALLIANLADFAFKGHRIYQLKRKISPWLSTPWRFYALFVIPK